MNVLYIFTDGGAKGNPGPAAVAFIVKTSRGKILVEQGKFIGQTTNNVAEYRAVIEALKWLRNNLINSVNSVNFFLDSKLVVNQLNGLFKVKNKSLRSLIVEVRKLEQEIGGNVFYNFIPREKNRKADFLVRTVLAQGAQNDPIIFRFRSN
ncbi:MAG: ribonuclease HI family protein [Microgenomates group bacterium]